MNAHAFLDVRPVGSSMRVLLVDRDDAPATAVIQYLAQHGVGVTRVSTAQTAWQQSLDQSFDVMVFDRCSPDSEVYGLVARLRDEGNETPVIVLTAVPDVAHACALGRLGVSDYLVKPVASATLLVAIRRAAYVQEPPPPPLEDSPVAWLAATLRAIRTGQSGGGAPLYTIQLGTRLATAPLNLLEFLTAAELLRCYTMQAPPKAWATRLLTRLRSEGRSRIPIDTRLSAIERMVLDVGTDWRTISPNSVSARLGVSKVSLWRLLTQTTHLSFRSIRRAIVVRSSLSLLAETHEHVRQIGFMVGYESHSCFDHDVRAVLGMSPSSFRKLIGHRVKPRETFEQADGTAS